MTSRVLGQIRELAVVGRAAGVDQVAWRLAGAAPDTFLVVRGEHAERRWWPLADVLILPAQPSAAAAVDVVTRANRWYFGCGLVAAGVVPGRCLALLRDGRHTIVRTRPRCGVFGTAAVSYLLTVAGAR